MVDSRGYLKNIRDMKRNVNCKGHYETAFPVAKENGVSANDALAYSFMRNYGSGKFILSTSILTD